MTKNLLALLLACVAFSSAQTQSSFTGVIADATCASVGHDSMRMAPKDAECTVVCVETHRDGYALVVGDTVYALSDQRTPEKFAAQKVTVVGTLNSATKTIQVVSITATK